MRESWILKTLEMRYIDFFQSSIQENIIYVKLMKFSIIRQGNGKHYSNTYLLNNEIKCLWEIKTSFLSETLSNNSAFLFINLPSEQFLNFKNPSVVDDIFLSLGSGIKHYVVSHVVIYICVLAFSVKHVVYCFYLVFYFSLCKVGYYKWVMHTRT